MTEESQRCVYCREEILDKHGMHWNIDHVVPKSVAPEFTFFPLNLALCCWGCNQAKGTSDPRTKRALKKPIYPSVSQDYRAYHPYFDEWDEHLYKDAESKLVIPRPGSTKGATIIEICNLQRLAARKAELIMNAKESRSIERVRELMKTGDVKTIEGFIQALESFSGSTDEFAALARQIYSSHLAPDD
ncbi:HNH endonuclease [Pseudarthrobacter sp. NIBRBAC000502770]|uniref:HNH endonuclease n=1 Tax=Pseudarthrobacter sp. NIBRBAC000502770 TaxID=2590785 RepID=UPI0011404FEE|nr:HNH endonuclease [Pseudarthrobacter sp. NIBRBAC000502770]QDG87528.1 HNH endonuclease [Pseudarthrobacter sp. NIBRBAC000502770]